MENKEIKLNVQLTEKDYLTFQKDHIKNQTGFLKPKALWIYSGILLVLILFVNRENLLDTGFLGINFTFLIPLIPIGLLILFKCIFSILIFSMKSRVKSSFESDPTINNPMEIIINKEGLTVNAYRANTNPLWKDIYRYLITKDTFYIYTSEVKSIIIPKRLLENTNDIDTLTDLLKNNVDFSGYKRQSTNGNYIKWGIRAVGILCFVFFAFIWNSTDSEKETQAMLFENNNDYKSASEIYSQLIKDNPEKDTYYPYRANCKIALVDYKAAILDCEKAISLNPENGMAYYMYAFALYNDGKYSEACKAIHKSIETGYIKEDFGLCKLPEN